MWRQVVSTDGAVLCIRLALGAVFILHGLQKFQGGIDQWAGTLKSLEVPYPTYMAYLSAGWELGGGGLLVIGFLSRLAALGLVAVMAVAILKVHLQHGFYLNHLNDPGKGHGYEFALVLLAMALSLVIAGAGKFSLDGLIFRRHSHYPPGMPRP